MLKDFIFKLIDWITFNKGFARYIAGFKIYFPIKFSRFFNENYEAENIEFVKEHIEPGATVLDIGGHIGLYAIIFSKLARKGGKVFSFEPTPYTRSIMEKVVKMNAHLNSASISVQPFAISDKVGVISFNVVPDIAGVANSMVAIEGAGSIDVETIDIDSFRNRNCLKIDFIKIDVEGAEYYALLGAKQTFMHDRPKATLGLHPWQIKSMNSSLDQIWDLLNSYEYHIQVGKKKLTKFEFCANKELFDVTLIPNEVASSN